MVLSWVQEGRGTDPLNEFTAYTLWGRRRHKTVEVSQQFDFAEGTRSDGAAVELLRLLETSKLHPLTNSTVKVRALAHAIT